MKKQFYLAAALALGAISLASCSSDDFLGQQSEVAKQKTAILFNSKSSKATRANLTGSEAATALDNEFRVYGSMTKDEAVTVPFDNYVVSYNGNIGADDTNVAGWTYLSDKEGNAAYSKGVTPALQEVHYWDLDAARYDFVAFAGLADTKRIAADNSNTITADANNRDKIFFSNRVTATYEATATGNTPNAMYGKPYAAGGSAANVLFTFYRLTSKVRCGIYETVPGYAVENVHFYYDDNYLAQAGTSTKTNFGLRGAFPQAGDYTIGYDNNNNPVTSYDGDNLRNNCTFGELQYVTAPSSLVSGGNLNADGSVSTDGEPVFIGSSAANTTFAAVGGEQWQTILPYENNNQRLVLRVDFDLVPHDGSQAIINVKGASAVVPLEYCQWKPNYAYTYIFKITDKVNGTTGTPDVNPPDPDTENPNPEPPVDPEALYPITFDAQVSNIIDFNQETITGITNWGGDAITTYVEGSAVVNNDEYLVGDNIVIASPSHGRWSVAYSNTIITEKQVADNNTFTYTTLAGAADDSHTIDQNSVYKALFTPDKAGYYIVWLRYLPTGLPDIEANYVDVFKVVKVN